MGKPEIIVQDFGGEHNKNLKQTRARLLKGGSWKKQRVIVLLPAASMIPARVMLAYWNLAFPPNQAVYKMLAQGMEVGEAYSSMIEQIVNHPELGQWEYVLTVEHDNAPPPDGLLRLLESMDSHPEFAAIGGLYFTKGEGGCAQIWGDVKDPILNYRPQPPDVSGGLVECYGTGMGFTLWRMSTFKNPDLPKPLFKTLASASGVGTQDLAAWTELRKFGYRCAIDCSVKVGHWDAAAEIMW